MEKNLPIPGNKISKRDLRRDGATGLTIKSTQKENEDILENSIVQSWMEEEEKTINGATIREEKDQRNRLPHKLDIERCSIFTTEPIYMGTEIPGYKIKQGPLQTYAGKPVPTTNTFEEDTKRVQEYLDKHDEITSRMIRGKLPI